mgnify:CR=1 FL=1
MQKVQIRILVEESDLDKLKIKAEHLGVSVQTYCRIILKKNANEFK